MLEGGGGSVLTDDFFVTQQSSQKTAAMEATQSKDHTGNTKPARVKMIPYIRVETLKNHTLLGGTSTI